jgi:hypothetical protein
MAGFTRSTIDLVVGAADRLQRRLDRSAAGVSHEHHQGNSEALRRKLHAGDAGGSHDVAGDADHEQIPQALIEDDLCGRP